MLMRCVAVLIMLALAGCSSGSDSPDSNAPSAASGKVLATRTGSQTVAGAVGGTQSVAITFTAEGANSVDQLTVGGLSNLPNGWQGPPSFSCTNIDTGSGCVLTLTFAPGGAGNGTLALTYTYRDAGVDGSGSIDIPYRTTAHNNAVATAQPSGQIVAVVGELAQDVVVTFTSDDGQPLTDIALTTSLTALPAGWSSALSSFACAQASTGNGCQLTLSFAPSAASTGTLALAYDYRDDSGASKSGSLNLAYAATLHNSVVATSSPAGAVTTIVGAKQPVAITFTTNDGRPASHVAITSDLASLASGWSSAVHDFRCDTVSTGNGCQLTLEFEPGAATSGALPIQYSYIDNAGRADSGTLILNYTGTTQNSIVTSASPSGQVATIVGGTQHVTVTFNTDDGNSATQFAITDDLTALPTGWSAGSPTLTCATVSTLNGCQLSLDYSPSAVGSGTVSLSYGYRNNSGVARTGTLNVPYVATSNNNAVATRNPSGAAHVVVGNSLPVTVTFTSDDGLALSNLQVTTNLAALPGGWSSGGSSFSCASVTSGTGCQLGLTYQPPFENSGTLAINFNYVNHAGIARTGSVSIPYEGFGPLLYVPQTTSNVVRCAVTSSGSFNGCATSLAAPGSTPHGMVFVGNRVYIAQRDADQLQLCNVEASGTLTGCVATGVGLDQPWSLTALGGRIYVMSDHTPAKIYSCTPDADGLIAAAGCVTKSDLAVAGYNLETYTGYVYLMDLNGVQRCSLFGTGAVSVCVTAGESSRVSSLAFGKGKVFMNRIATHDVRVCDVHPSTGLFSNCAAYDLSIPNLLQAAFHGNTLYLAARDTMDAHLFYCPLDQNDLPLIGCPRGQVVENPGQMRVR